MIIIILISLYLFSMILFTLFIMYLAVCQNDYNLLYFGLGIPFWLYLLVLNLRRFSKIEVENDFVIIKYLLFRDKKIFYNKIDKWEETVPLRIPQIIYTLYVNGRKISISSLSLSDSESLNDLSFVLHKKLAEKEKNHNKKNQSPNR